MYLLMMVWAVLLPLLFECVLRKSASMEKIWFCLPTCTSWGEVVHPVTSHRTCLRHTRDVTRYSMTSRQLCVVHGKYFVSSQVRHACTDLPLRMQLQECDLRDRTYTAWCLTPALYIGYFNWISTYLTYSLTGWPITLLSNSLEADKLSTTYQHTFLDFTENSIR
jgi:hypothetical protein